MTVRCKGRLKQRNSSAGGFPVFDYHSPKITLPCERILDDKEALVKMSSEVKVYFTNEEDENKNGFSNG